LTGVTIYFRAFYAYFCQFYSWR